MNASADQTTNVTFRPGEVVQLSNELVGIPAPDGGLVPSEKLGLGLIGHITPEGTICVHWVNISLEACLPYEDLRPLGPNAHLVVMKRYDRRSLPTSTRHRVASGLGFAHNWTVEMRHPNVVRTLRDDGCAWTFTRNSVFNRIDAQWDQPRNEDDAEALTVAELVL